MLGAVLLLVRALPASLSRLLSQAAVITYLALRPDYRLEIADNFRAIFGYRRRLFWLANACRLGTNLSLMAQSETRRGQAIVDTAVIYADNITRRYLEQELHMIMASFHFGAWEYLPKIFARRGLYVYLTVGKQHDGSVDDQLTGLRQAPNVRLSESPGEALRVLAKPGVSGFMLDNTSLGVRTPAQVDGIMLRLPSLPFRLSRRAGAQVIPAVARAEKGRLRVDMGRPGDEESAARFMVQQVRAHPEEWIFWGKAGAVG